MKQILTLLLVLCLKLATAQQYNKCGILIPPPIAVNNFLSVYETGRVVKAILDSINWRSNFVIQEKNGINNAYATILNKQRYIIYDNNFLSGLDRYTGTQWASISVIAHEMGHHYRNHVITSAGSTPPKELEADYFSGYVLAKLGASLAEATAAIQSVSAVNPSSTHPGRADRVAAIAQGWNYERGTTSAAQTRMPAPKPKENPPPNTSQAGWISLYLYGNSDMTVYLSDNGRSYAPARLKASQPFVFKYEVYNYGFMRFANDQQATTYKLVHGRDYAIVWNRRTNYWTLVAVE